MGEIQVSTGEVSVLLLTGNMVVTTESEEGLHHILKIVSDTLSKWELKVNGGRLKLLG